MQSPRTRRVQRVHLPQPLIAKLGTAQVVLVDLSILGARIEHHSPLAAGLHSRLAFEWEGEPIEIECRIVRSRLERFSTGSDGLTIYHAGLEFDRMTAEVRGTLKRIIAIFITRALEEQKLNARGVMPQHDVAKMPIFRRGGMLTANSKDVKESVGASVLPSVRVAKESGYVCYQLDHNNWRKKRTHDPGQPLDGFTISALEDSEQGDLLCDAYLRSDRDGRRMIQLFAQLSIMEGDGVLPGRFEP
jgi:hypothetical protein